MLDAASLPCSHMVSPSKRPRLDDSANEAEASALTSPKVPSSSQKVELELRGDYFNTDVATLRSMPDSLLASLVTPGDSMVATTSGGSGQMPIRVAIDRNPSFFQPILELYRTGALHLPDHMEWLDLRGELDFFQVPTEALALGWQLRIRDSRRLDDVVSEMTKTLQIESVPGVSEQRFGCMFHMTHAKRELRAFPLREDRDWGQPAVTCLSFPKTVLFEKNTTFVVPEATQCEINERLRRMHLKARWSESLTSVNLRNIDVPTGPPCEAKLPISVLTVSW